MKSRVFRALIQSMLVATLPVTLQAGCGTCTRSDASLITEGTSLRVRGAAWACEPLCGVGVQVCTVTIAGQNPLALDCDGQPPAMSLPSGVSIALRNEDCPALCDSQAVGCEVSNEDTRYPGQLVRRCSTHYACPQQFGAIEGRRPADVQFAGYSAEQEVGAFFAEVYQLEAAAIAAFSILADELRAHGAPAALIAAAKRAEADEVRHTQMAASLARRFSAQISEPSVGRHSPRPLLAIALENAIEGCVREAYGAFVASWQGEYAHDARVRAIMSRVARDEIQHAELAFAIDAWILPLLSEAERAQVETARAQAFRELMAQCQQPPSTSLQAVAGLPPQAAAQAFLQAHAQLAC